MNFIKSLVAGVALVAAAVSAGAGQYGIDAFQGYRTVLSAQKPTLVNGAAAIYTNGPIDKLNWIGDGKLDVFCNTNAAVNWLNVQIYGSSDTTNWVQVTNLAVATPAAQTITNLSVVSSGLYFLGNTNFVITNNVLYPFSINTASGVTGPSGGANGINAFAQGFATPYTQENAFTNSSFTFSNAVGEIGFHCIDMPRYLDVVFTAGGGGATNINAQGIFTVPVSNIQP